MENLDLNKLTIVSAVNNFVETGDMYWAKGFIVTCEELWKDPQYFALLSVAAMELVNSETKKRITSILYSQLYSVTTLYENLEAMKYKEMSVETRSAAKETIKQIWKEIKMLEGEQ